jgi:hypothetical protein
MGELSPYFIRRTGFPPEEKPLVLLNEPVGEDRPEPGFWDLWRVIRKHKRLIVVFFLAEDTVLAGFAFDAASARTLRDLFDLVGQHPGTEVSVGGRKVPYGHELWLPLFWIFVGAEA